MNIKDLKGADIQLSGERFKVTYKIFGEENEAYQMAKKICLEETVDLPEEFIPSSIASLQTTGTIESFESTECEVYYATISYLVESAEGELTQLLNVVFGNISTRPGIQVLDIELPESILSLYNGPRFGIEGLRDLLKITERPLLCAELKPMGLTPSELAKLAYEFALGGIDIIVDYPGLTDQSFAPYDERVSLCSEAVRKANSVTGYKSIYAPNITAPYDDIFIRAEIAKKEGANGLLIAPGLVGIDTMRCLVDDINITLPIISHPAFQGTFTVGPDGISHGLIYGQIARLAGADITVFPHYGNSFSFSKNDCLDIVNHATRPMGHIRSIFPCPARGISLENILEILEVYGKDVVLLLGSDLYKSDLSKSCRNYRKIVENAHKLDS